MERAEKANRFEADIMMMKVMIMIMMMMTMYDHNVA
jgi:hypothetical protein